MREVSIERTAYPRLWGNIEDKEVIFLYTLESEELSLVRDYGGNILSLAVRLKVFGHLLSHNLPLSDVPQQVVDYVASQLQVPSVSLSETRKPRYEQIKIIRQYSGFSPFTKEQRNKLEAWLISQAEKQFHLVDLVNEAIFHLKEMRVELPSFQRLLRLVSSALHQVDRRQSELVNQHLSKDEKDKLDSQLQSECQYQRTPFYELKEPPEKPSASSIIKEIQLLQRLRSFNICFNVLGKISNERIKHFSEIAKSYKSNELYDLTPETRYPILLCFIYMRIKEVTDNIVELLIRLWNQMTRDAEKAQNDYVLKREEVKEQSEELYEQFLEIIVESTSKDEIVDRIFDLKSYEEYKSILEMIRRFKRPKKEKYFEALSARYSFVRRFIPLIWEHLTFRSNTSDNTLIQALEYIKENLQPSIPELPVKDAPVSFVPDSWDRHVFVRQRSTRKILSINKRMYELCIVEQLIDKIIASEIYVSGSQYYSSLEEYLISKEEFTSSREDYIRKLNLPETAEEFIKQLMDELQERLDYVNQNYENLKPYTKVSRGSLSFSRIEKEKVPEEIERLTNLITARLKPVSIIDIIIDIDKLTGFFSLFEPVGYRERMTPEQKAKRMVAMLL
jgi:hypothetical protein